MILVEAMIPAFGQLGILEYDRLSGTAEHPFTEHVSPEERARGFGRSVVQS